MASQDVTHFTTVDHTADPGFFLHFLDEVNKLAATVVWKSAVLNGLGVQPGAQVLDVGCGMGTDAFDLPVRVGPGGHVTGVDFSESLIGDPLRTVLAVKGSLCRADRRALDGLRAVLNNTSLYEGKQGSKPALTNMARLTAIQRSVWGWMPSHLRLVQLGGKLFLLTSAFIE
jgi:SAM-dependent methyltransferase